MLDERTDGRRDHIVAESDSGDVEQLTLPELRKARKMTQAQLADVMNIRQASVAQTEIRKEMMASTLRSYVEAMGGKLSFVAEFPDRPPVSLQGLGNSGIFPRRRPHSPVSPKPEPG
ncbi:MAG: helix-turn-helix transcriptional regulator [Rhodobacteraceae bacterium]|nr:helix-turn-helix transcriptional regulator [Paracoccaceae bacterium]